MIDPSILVPDISELARAQEQKLRDSFWDGIWQPQLQSDLKAVLGSKRQEVVGVPDMSCCLGPQICRELAVCYLSPPTTTLDGKAAPITEPKGPVAKALLWSLMPDFQGRVLWLREYIIRLDVTTTGDLLYRVVPPWLVEVEADPAKPDQPIIYREWVLRTFTTTNQEGNQVKTTAWTRDVIDLTDPKNPTFVVLTQDGQQDITKEVFKREMSGSRYPYKWASGVPWMPAELYHRDPDSNLWHFSQGAELVSATRHAAVLWSLFLHGFRDASWAQRVLIDGVAQGSSASSASGLAYIVPDVTLILMANSQEGKQAQLGQWNVPAMPADLLAGIQGYLAQAATREGVSPAELQRLSGDPKSGISISLTNAGKRQAQRRFGPQFKIRDESLICKSAALWNRWHPKEPQYAEEGYQVAYTSIPLSPDEELAIRDQVDWELGHGFITLEQACARVLGVSITEARAILKATREYRLAQAKADAELAKLMQPDDNPDEEPTPDNEEEEPAHA